MEKIKELKIKFCVLIVCLLVLLVVAVVVVRNDSEDSGYLSGYDYGYRSGDAAGYWRGWGVGRGEGYRSGYSAGQSVVSDLTVKIDAYIFNARSGDIEIKILLYDAWTVNTSLEKFSLVSATLPHGCYMSWSGGMYVESGRALVKVLVDDVLYWQHESFLDPIVKVTLTVN